MIYLGALINHSTALSNFKLSEFDPWCSCSWQHSIIISCCTPCRYGFLRILSYMYHTNHWDNIRGKVSNIGDHFLNLIKVALDPIISVFIILFSFHRMVYSPFVVVSYTFPSELLFYYLYPIKIKLNGKMKKTA